MGRLRATPSHPSVAVLSGALVGTGEAGGTPRPGLYGHTEKRFDYRGRLYGVPILIGCHERDPYIPLERVHRSAQVLAAMRADVSEHVIPGAGHAVVAEEATRMRAHINDGQQK